MKMKMKMKNGSHRYDTNRPRSRHGYKYSKYKKSLTIIMLTYIKQHLRNIKPFLKMEKEHAYVVFIYMLNSLRNFCRSYMGSYRGPTV